VPGPLSVDQTADAEKRSAAAAAAARITDILSPYAMHPTTGT